MGNLGWIVSAADGLVTPKRTDDVMGDEGPRGVEADQQRLRQMAKYLQLFEQKALEVGSKTSASDRGAFSSGPSDPVDMLDR